MNSTDHDALELARAQRRAAEAMQKTFKMRRRAELREEQAKRELAEPRAAAKRAKAARRRNREQS